MESWHKCSYCGGVDQRWPCMSQGDAAVCDERKRLKPTQDEARRLEEVRRFYTEKLSAR